MTFTVSSSVLALPFSTEAVAHAAFNGTQREPTFGNAVSFCEQEILDVPYGTPVGKLWKHPEPSYLGVIDEAFILALGRSLSVQRNPELLSPYPSEPFEPLPVRSPFLLVNAADDGVSNHFQ